MSIIIYTPLPYWNCFQESQNRSAKNYPKESIAPVKGTGVLFMSLHINISNFNCYGIYQIYPNGKITTVYTVILKGNMQWSRFYRNICA